MVSGRVTVKNKKGLHIKPAGALSSIAMLFSCSVFLNVRTYNVNAKSVLGVLSAQVRENEEVEIVCSGADEDECLRTIISAINDKFGME